ncbi:amino acid ABC transporter substrate-binding protein [Paenibacillus selenitireducens]|uniref:Amino acid ABC transporter substrate-binding protein n=1 Tax=Paenibacillus selenitireducens TaxID=1324314 RepID=A0A1T2X446_9BACL|nr:ABC transporter permease subunit [Paenibacillus selenitireducens]OPA74627.1 amino acid ABC transporter substrate-binding protein [Paenibacillus selenitireducens]
MKKIQALLVCLFVFTWITGYSTPALAASDNQTKSKKLVLGTSADYPPYEFHKKINGKDQILGFDIEIAKEIAKDMGAELVIEDMKFDSLLLALNAGKVDMVMSAMNPTEERRKNVDFSNIYYQSDQAVLIRAEDKDKYTTMDDLKGKHIGAQKSSIYEDMARAVPNATVDALAKISDLVLSLESKRIDAIVLELPVAESYEKNRSTLAVAEAKPESSEDGYAIAFRKGSTDMVNQVNTTIDRLEKADMINKYVADASKLAEAPSGTNIFTYFNQNKQYFLSGVGWTLLLSLVTVVFGLILGIILVLMRLSKVKPLKWIAVAYIEFLRGTPLMVQLFIIYFGLPSIGIEFPKFLAGAIALSLNSAAYLAEIFRAGIQSIDKGQLEAARSLGMGHSMAMRFIILPQALKQVLPAIGNEFVVIIKESSIVSLIGITDIMYQEEVVRGSTYAGLPPLLIAAVLYFILTFVCTKLLGIAERRLKTSD